MIVSNRDERTRDFAAGKRVRAFSRVERSARLKLDRLASEKLPLILAFQEHEAKSAAGSHGVAPLTEQTAGRQLAVEDG